MKNLINKIFFWMGYIPLDSTVKVIEEPSTPIQTIQSERLLPSIGFSSRFEMDDYMNCLLREMRHEIADKSSDMFEVIKETGRPSLESFANTSDKVFIKLNLNVVPPKHKSNQQ